MSKKGNIDMREKEMVSSSHEEAMTTTDRGDPSSRGDGFPAHAARAGGGAASGALFSAASGPPAPAPAPWHPRPGAEGRGRGSGGAGPRGESHRIRGRAAGGRGEGVPAVSAGPELLVLLIRVHHLLRAGSCARPRRTGR